MCSICLILSSCDISANEPSTETVSNSNVNIQDSLPFSFKVPDEYTFAKETYYSISIMRDNEIIGGVVRTDLHKECIQGTNCTHLREYLRNFAPHPLNLEFLNTIFEGTAYISVTITNSETGSQHKQSHHIFERDSEYFDLWLDKELVNADQRSQLIDSIMNPQT